MIDFNSRLDELGLGTTGLAIMSSTSIRTLWDLALLTKSQRWLELRKCLSVDQYDQLERFLTSKGIGEEGLNLNEPHVAQQYLLDTLGDRAKQALECMLVNHIKGVDANVMVLHILRILR